MAVLMQAWPKEGVLKMGNIKKTGKKKKKKKKKKKTTNVELWQRKLEAVKNCNVLYSGCFLTFIFFHLGKL